LSAANVSANVREANSANTAASAKTPRLEVTAAYVRARPDKVLRSAGGTSTDYLLAQVAWKL
jgi:hypothetical protein